MTLALSRMAACSLAVCLGGWGAPLWSEGAEICDDLEDGDVFDGNPMCWTTQAGFPAILEYEGGDLKIRNAQAGSYGIIRTCDSFNRDVEIRASARIDDPAGTGELDLALHCDGVLSGYVAEFRRSGSVQLQRFINGNRTIMGAGQILGFTPGEERIFEFSVRGDKLEARAWAPSADRPVVPAATATDTTFQAGYAELCAYSPDLGSSFRVVYSSVCIHPPTYPVEFPHFRRGDANDDGAADISDAVFTLNWLFTGGKAPGCVASADANGDGGTDISDAVYLLGYLFLGGPPPEPPFPGCGHGSLPTDETLGCATAPKSCAQP